MVTGFILGNLAGGFFTFYLSWRLVFVLAAIMAALDLILIFLRVRQECELSLIHDYDPVGMLAYSGAVFLIFYGVSKIGHLTGLALFATGTLLLAGFVVWERRYPFPLIPKDITKSRVFAWAAASNLTFQGSSFAIIFLLSLQFQYVSNIDPRVAGVLLIIPQAVMIVLSPISGRLSDRIPPMKIAGVGCLISIAGILILVFVSEGTSLPILIMVLLLVGIGTALFMPSVISWALMGVPRETYNVASSMTETSRLAGMTLSNAVVIVVFGVIMGGAVVGPSNIPQFVSSVNASAIIFLIMAGICAAMAFWTLVHNGNAIKR
jgi:MFS family permease